MPTLLACGVFGSLLYPLSDMLAGNLYKGYSFNQQTVSELFAIGAPTSQLVVVLFSLSSILLLAFAFGVWLSAGVKRMLHALAVMIFANAVNSLVLWNFFPMHMRGVQMTFTDTMHGILAINPFVLLSIILGAGYYKDWFRYYSIVTLVVLVVGAIIAFPMAMRVSRNEATPGLGIAERVSQYAHQLWHALLAMKLLRKRIVSAV